MGRELWVLWAGRHRRDRWQDLVDGYRKRLRRLVPVRDRQVRSRRDGTLEERRRAEGRAMKEALPRRSWLIALDADGKSFSSVEFSEHLERLLREWPDEVVFAVGSDAGLHEDLLERADEVLSLGPMTLPHELARLVLYEQIYRAMTLQRGMKYHR